MSVAYFIERSTLSSGPWSEVAGPFLASPQTYSTDAAECFYLRIRREVNTSLVAYSEPVEVVTLDAPNLTASGGVGVPRILLTWDSTCAPSYRIYRFNPLVSEYEALAETSDLDYEDYDAPYNVAVYYYIVGLTDTGCEGPASNVTFATLSSGGVFTMSRATLYQSIQLGVESTPGTGVAASKLLKNMGLEYTPETPKRKVGYPGSRAGTDTQQGKPWTSGRFTGVLDFNHFIYFLSSRYGTVATSTAETLDFTRNWNPSTTLPITPKTYTIEQGSTARGAEKWTNVIFDDLSIRGGQDEVTIEGSWFGQKTQRGITKTTTPTTIAPKAVQPYTVGLYYSEDGASWTRLTKGFDWEIRFGKAFRPDFHVNDATASFDDTVELMPDNMGWTLTFEEGSEVTTMVDYFYGLDKVWLRMLAQGPLIEAGTPDVYHTVNVDMPTWVMKEAPGDQDGAWGNQITFDVADDDAFGLADISVTNLLSTAAAGV